MRRLFVLAVLLLVPAAGADAADRPTNGCPAPCSGQVSSPAGTQFLYVQPAGVGGAGRRLRPVHGRRVLSLPPGDHLRRRCLARERARCGCATRSSPAISSRPRRPRAGWSSTAAGGSRASRRTDASPRSRDSPDDRRLTHVTVVNVFSKRIAHRLRLRGNFEVETVSRDGKRLFLIEHLPGTGAPRYSIRLFDLSRDRLASKPLRGAASPA